jgi:hypothetical protein
MHVAANPSGVVSSSPPAAGYQQAKWREYIEGASQQQWRTLRSEVAKLHREEYQSAVIRCSWCAGTTCKLDSVDLLCHPERRPQTAAYDARADKPPHTLCISCVVHLVKNQERFLVRQLESDRRAGEDTSQLEWLMNIPLKVLPCPLCKTPNVLTMRTAFNESLARKVVAESGAATQYKVHFSATNAVCDNFTVEEVFENERRPMFGSFSPQNVLTLDWRGRYSNGGGSAMERSISPKPNRAWVWLETHAPDVTLPNTGVGGWQYAKFSWAADPLEYSPVISIFHFVRRRRLLHTRVRMNEDVQNRLSAVVDELERTGQGRFRLALFV